MKTSKPVSTISYNTEPFLKMKIEQWKSQGFIEFAMYIKHKAESNDKKDHFHVYLKPQKQIQTFDLEQSSLEFVSDNEKPLKCMDFRISSSEYDWIMYAIHDKGYLAQKGLEKECHYDLSDIQSTCEDTFNIILTRLQEERKGTLEERLMFCIGEGLNWKQIVSSGLIPLAKINNARIFYQAVTGQDNFDGIKPFIVSKNDKND